MALSEPVGRNGRTARWWAGRAAVTAVSLGAHVLVILAVMFSPASPISAPEAEPIVVELLELPPEAPEAPAEPAAEAAAAPEPEDPTPVIKPIVSRAPPRPTPAPAPIGPPPAPLSKPSTGNAATGLSDSQLAGAATSGSGAGGRPCNMVHYLETQLRKDEDVQAFMADAHRVSSGRAILVWNGDWVRMGDQEGNGLAGVREAIMVKVAFAPEACRADPVQGMVLISLADGPNSARLVLGEGAWRWPDLLVAGGRRR